MARHFPRSNLDWKMCSTFDRNSGASILPIQYEHIYSAIISSGINSRTPRAASVGQHQTPYWTLLYEPSHLPKQKHKTSCTTHALRTARINGKPKNTRKAAHHQLPPSLPTPIRHAMPCHTIPNVRACPSQARSTIHIVPSS